MITDNDATDLSSDEDENPQGENSKRQKRFCKEIIIKNGKTKVTSKMVSSKEKNDKITPRQRKKYRGIRMNKRNWLGSFATMDEATLTNILKPPPKESDPIHL
uniref:AP2/ERF domain-containing protein n=1 Tax=Solanum lycopersicum TaxID=4081 RepID=A0A3Q7EBA0_SOLLC